MHEGLDWLAESPEGSAWLEALPDVLADCASRWSLVLGEPFGEAFESLAVPARRADGMAAVLKIAFRGHENRFEAAALRHWGGDGAVWLLDYDEQRNALLLEQAQPGTPLADESSDTALEVYADLLPRLWKPAGRPFRTVADEAAWWAGELQRDWELAGRPFERELLDVALQALHDLPPTQGEIVLVHQDLHAGNVLRATRQPWLVIDPKPMLAEREFSLAPIVRGAELGHSRDAVIGRLDRLCQRLRLDRDRARRWTIAQTLAWAISDSGAIPEHVEVSRWLLRDA